MDRYEVGVITDSRIGCNFALRLKENGYSCVLYHTGIEKMSRDEINKYVSDMQEKGINTATSIDITLSLLKSPKRIFIVSKSSIYSEPLLFEIYEGIDTNDIVIDTCDADYNTTASRCRLFEKKKAFYLGVGFSGEAAERLDGMSFMVGGSKDAYIDVSPILRDISSKFRGEECCAYIGPDGAGHYAKMINNGIEYGVMQLETGNKVKQVGFVELDEHVGVSPDGLVNDDGLVEIKNPSDKVFFKLVETRKIDKKHLDQMQMQMFVTQRSWCDYFAFNPNFDPCYVKIRVPKDIEVFKQIVEGLQAGKQLLKSKKEQLDKILITQTKG